MRLDDVPESENIEDRRGDGSGGGGGGFGLPMGMGGGGLGIGTIVVLGIIGYALGIDPRILIGGAEMMSGGGQQQQAPQSKGKTGAPSDDMGKFVARVLGSADVQWKLIFEQAGQRYRPPTLVMFNGATRADQCGMAQSAMGPFYCPPDNKIYLARGPLTMPVLAVGGEKSFGETMAAVTRFAATNVKGVVIPDSGHWLMEEQPAATTAAIVEFLR